MQRRSSQLSICYNPAWKRQTAWDAPLSGSDLTAAFPATSRNYLDLDETVEDVMDCTGEDLLLELLTGRFARLNIDFDVDPDILAGMAAFAFGVSGAPTPGTNEVQLETLNASAGSRSLTFQVGADTQTTTDIPWNANAATIQAALEALSNLDPGDVTVAATSAANEVQTETIDPSVDGGNRTLTFMGQTTAPIAWNANAAAIQAALELLSNVAPGDITVAGAGPYTYTFGGAYANTPVPMIVVTSSLTDGGLPVTPGSTFVETTPGVATGFTYTFAGDMAGQQVSMLVPNTFNLTGTSVFSEATPGIGNEHQISRLIGYTLPLMTLYIGFRGSDKAPAIFKNVVVNNLRVRAATREKVTASVELIGTWNPDEVATGYVVPPCQDILPIRFGECGMYIAGTDYIANNLGREFEFNYSNNVNPQFDGASVDSTRHERADARTTDYSFFVLGEPEDPIFNLAKLRQRFITALRLGPVGRNVTFTAPSAIVKLAPSPIRFGGDPAESEVSIVGRPAKVKGNSLTPVNALAYTAQATAMLST